MKIKQPTIEGRFWRMPDGELVRRIYGGSDETPEEKNARLEKELKAANGEAAANRKALRDLEKATEGFDAEEFAKMKTALTDTTRQQDEAKGNYEKALKDYKEQHDAALQAANADSAGWKQKFEGLAVDNQLISAASNAVDPKAAVLLLKSDYQFNVLDDGKVEILKDGKIQFDEKGAAIAPSALMESYLSEKPWMAKANENAGSGGNNQQKGKVNDGEKSTQDKVADGLNSLLAGNAS